MRNLIVGAGYVGVAIGRALLAVGEEVTVTTTTPAKVEGLESLGFKVLVRALDDDRLPEEIGDFDRLFFAVAPHSTEEAESVYLAPAKILNRADRLPSQVIYTSSTGVYGAHKGEWVDEATLLAPISGREKILVQAEDALRLAFPNVIILRLGGIIGPGRELKKRLENPLPGKPEQPFNWVSVTDIVGSTLFILENGLTGTFNVISQEGMTRGEAYQVVAAKEGRRPPQFNSALPMTHGGWRWVSNEKLRTLGYKFCGELQ